MAHIDRRERNRWRARYRGPDGRERSKTFQRRTDAERWLHSVEAAKVRGDWIDPNLGKTSLQDWAARWLDAVGPTLKPSTAELYSGLLRSRILPGLGACRLAALRPIDVQAWISDMERSGLSAGRIRHAHVVLSQILDAAARDGLIARNAARGAKLPRLQRREAAYLEPKVVDRIAAAMPGEYGLLIRILGTLGLRFGEAAALRRRSVDLLRRRLMIDSAVTEVAGRLTHGSTKSHAVRVVPLPVYLAAELELHLSEHPLAGPDAPLFLGPRGGPLRRSVFYNRIWLPTLAQLGLPRVRLHALRHSAAARLIAAGATPKALQSVLGHANAGFSLTVYGHLFDTDLDALADRLDAQTRGLPRPGRGLARNKRGPREALHLL